VASRKGKSTKKLAKSKKLAAKKPLMKRVLFGA